MKKLGKVLGIIATLIVLAAVGIFGINKYFEYQREKERKEAEAKQWEALGKINYEIPDIFDYAPGLSFASGVCHYIYAEEDGMKADVYEPWNHIDIEAHIDVTAFNKEEAHAWRSVDAAMDNIIEEAGSHTIIQGPEDIDLNGLKGKILVYDEGHTVSEENGVRFKSRNYYYIVENDEFLYVITYKIYDYAMRDQDVIEANKCVTSREPFINSIGSK